MRRSKGNAHVRDQFRRLTGGVGDFGRAQLEQQEAVVWSSGMVSMR